MFNKRKGNIPNIPIKIIALLCSILSVICFSIRLFSVVKGKKENIELFAAEFILPDADKASLQQEMKKTSKPNNKTKISSSSEFENSTSSEPKDENNNHENENKYNIIESQFSEGGIGYDNFYVKNSTGYDLNIGEELSKKPDINFKKDGSPQVLIVHTHTSESYMENDLGFYYESFYPRSTDNEKNVVKVGNAISNKLKENGIETIHDTTYHDIPSYNGSYSRSSATINNILEAHPSIQVVLDIHRDSIGNNENGKVKPTFKVNGQKAAQIMVVSGCDLDGSMDFPDWEYNLRFALRVQKVAETLYPGMTRPMSFGEFRYNMNITHGSLLIEIGTDANTLDEAVRTGGYLGNVLTNVLNDLQN